MDLQFQDLDELAKFALEGIHEKRFVIMIGIDHAHGTLTDRANRIGRGAQAAVAMDATAGVESTGNLIDERP